MKIRNGFVSNSSSSSFVLAITETCSEEDLKEIFLKYKERFDEMEDTLDYEIGKRETYLTEDAYYDKIASMLAKEFYSYFNNKYSNPVEISNWLIVAEYMGWEDGLMGEFLYGILPNLNEDKIIIRGY